MKYSKDMYCGSGLYLGDTEILNYEEKLVKCIKPHKCSNCQKEIKAGEQALLESCFADDNPVEKLEEVNGEKMTLKHESAKADDYYVKLIPVKTPENWTVYNQLNKVKEELEEAFAAFNNVDRYDLCEELIDIQTACETALDMLGCNINIVRGSVNSKNRQRGYID